MRRSFDVFILVIIFLLATGVLPAQQSFHVLRSGSDCGRVTLSFERLAHGYMQCELREERRYQGIDEKSATWRRSLTILVDSALQILSVNGREFSDAGEYTVKGSCVEGVLYFSRESKSGRMDSWRDDCSAVPDIFLPELAIRADIPTPDRVFFVRDFASRATTVRITDEQPGTVRVAIGDGSEFILDAKGAIQSWGIPALDLAWQSEDLPAAGVEPCAIDCGVFWDAGQVTLPTETENIRSMNLRLSITRDVGARLIPEDLRQRIADDKSNSGASVSLHIARLRQVHGDAMLPILDEDMIGYQTENPLMPVTAEAVRDRAALLRAMTRSAGTVAGEIQRWMREQFIEDDFVPVVAADRLVRSSRGSSLHASMLLVTLARAAGIPARLVLGFRPERARWRSTVWTELWTGRWMSIDPVNGEFIDDAVHVKLLHASDVSELREQAGRLRGAVRLDILSMEEIDGSAAGKLNTGVFNGTYSDRAFKCVIRAPQNWIIEQRVKGNQTDVFMSPEPGSAVRFEMQLTHNPYPLATRAVYDAKVMALGVVLADVQIMEKGEVRFGERKVPYILYSYRDTRSGARGDRITTADCIFTIAERGYLFRFTAPSQAFHEYDNTLQNILQNVVLYED
ncbi:MAG: transglutaminase-like domain-containing protein [Bacteroidota bacterium]|jgi:hypothetical protein